MGYDPIFSSRGAAYYSRLQLGLSGTTHNIQGTSTKVRRNEVLADFSMDYGLPGKPGYEYTRPFDYFAFQATASSANVFENILTRGLLVRKAYEAASQLSGRLGPLRQLRLHFAANLPHIEHRTVSRHHGPGMADAKHCSAGHRPRRRRLRRRGNPSRRVRGRLPLWRGAAGPAGAARHFRRQGRARRDGTGVFREPGGPIGGHDNIARADLASRGAFTNSTRSRSSTCGTAAMQAIRCWATERSRERQWAFSTATSATTASVRSTGAEPSATLA